MKFYKSEKGVALIITFFVMTIMLSIVLGIGAILFIEIKTIRGLGYSVVAFYAADSGIEKTLYYDKKVLTGGGLRGLCDIPNTCSNCQIRKFDGNDCGVDTCTDCDIYFSTEFGEKKYKVDAEIRPSEQTTVTSIKSFGTYRGTTRAIELTYFFEGGGPPSEGPSITNADVIPRSVPEGIELSITADISDPDGVDPYRVQAEIQSPDESTFDFVFLTLSLGNEYYGTYTGTWTGPEGVYFVDITACDIYGNCSTAENI